MRHLRTLDLAAAALAVTLLLPGCADMNMAAFNGDLGVTPGGAQDIGVARALIEDGRIPDHAHFRVEGLFSEHDLPLPGEACAELLCPRAAAMPIAPIDGSGPYMLVQLGFATSLGADFERAPQNLSLVVDISGSMADGKLDAVKDALTVLVGQLDAADRASLVAFDDSAALRLSARAMDAAGRASLQSAIDDLQPDGGTNIEAGLDRGYGQVAPVAGEEGRGDRVMLFTDAQPNIGATDLDSFLGMVRYYSASGIGISVFGVGLDLGAELAQEVSQTRGGNYFYLADDEAIARVFDDEFDLIVTPLAYDLEVAVDAAEGLQFDQAWGAPLDQPGARVEFGVSTLFLSARGGGMGVALAPLGDAVLPEAGPADLASFALSYQPADGSEPVADALAVAWSGGVEIGEIQTTADALGVYKMGVLLDEYLALTAGADFCDGTLDATEAGARISEAVARLDAVAVHLDDAPLAAEVILMQQLADNVAQSRPCAAEDSVDW